MMTSENFVFPSHRTPLLSNGFWNPEASSSVTEDDENEAPMTLFSDASMEIFRGDDDDDTISKVTFAMHDLDADDMTIRLGPLIDTDKNLSMF